MNWKENLRELIIVVLGILIAFALNSWAQSRKTSKMEQQYLTSLHDDLVADSLELYRRLGDLNRRTGLARRAIGFVFSPNQPASDSAFTLIFRDLHSQERFLPNASTYEALIYSGDLQLISDFELRKNIAGHYHRYSIMEDENNRADHFIRSSVVPYMMNNTEMRKLGRSDQVLDFSDPLLQNIIFASFGILDLQIDKTRQSLENCRYIIRKIVQAMK